MKDVSLQGDPTASNRLLMEGENSVEHRKCGSKVTLSIGLILVISIVVVTLAMTGNSGEDWDGNLDHVYLYRQELPERYTSADADLPAWCNDQTIPPYYFSEGQEGSEANYVLFFPGGAGCWDEETCDSRVDVRFDDMTANNASYMLGRGLYNPGLEGDDLNSNPFREWNIMLADYCSSDAFSGRMSYEDTDNTLPWHFAGDSIFWGIVDGLLEDHGMTNAERIVVSAASAGAEGLFQQLDRLVEYLAIYAPDATVDFIINNGWHIYGVDNWYSDDPEKEERDRQGMFDAWKPNINDACIAAQENGEEYLCLYTGNILYPFLNKKDFHVHYHLYDSHSLDSYGVEGDYTLWDNETFEFADYLADAFVASFEATEQETAWTAPACFQHDDFDKKEWTTEAMEYEWESGVYDYLVADMMYDFVMNEDIRRQYDTCGSLNCNPTCRD